MRHDILKEIESLRAIAVVSVVLFHAKFEQFGTGFVGVDIFFVISGFLITRVIFRSIDNNDFSYLEFYDRRARRLLPALYAVILCSLPFAFYWMLPDDLENFGQSIVATVLYTNNILLYATSGYWNSDNDLKPLLHTWSLGLEEQYYIILPLVLVALKSSYRLPFIWIVIVLSLTGYLLIPKEREAFAFFMLPMRAWELCVGSAIAAYQHKISEHKKTVEVNEYIKELAVGTSILVVLVIAFTPMLDFDNNRIQVIPSVIATAVIIQFGGSSKIFSRLFKCRAIVWIGGLSYSIYLVHQPIFAIARHASLDALTYFDYIYLIFLTLALAYFLNKFVENPFRSKNTISPNIFYKVIGGVSLVLVALGLLLHFTSGFASLNSITGSGGDYFSRGQNIAYNERVWKIERTPFSADSKAKILVVGNSFARDFVNISMETLPAGSYSISYLSNLASCAEGLPSDSSEAGLIQASDIVIYGSVPYDEACIKRDEEYFQRLGKRFWLVGPKNFGYSLSAIMKLEPEIRYEFRVKVVPTVTQRNESMRSLVAPENYIDILRLISDEEGLVPVFSDRKLLLSHDREHLTKEGARYIGHIFFSKHPAGLYIKQFTESKVN
jgi:peptidoglycan/LPS O-acetylase OafA/YrhL